MKPIPILVTLITLGIAVSAVAWMSRPVVTDAVTTPEVPPSTNPLDISKEGPFPKAAIDSSRHEFGVLALGEQGEHSFVIRNEGEAPLRLRKGLVQCKCTVPTVPEEEVPPGESVEILMTFKPEAAADEFHQKAVIWTNDPEHQELELHVIGAVYEIVTLEPEGTWTIGRLVDGEQTPFTGVIFSKVQEQFEISGWETSSELVSIETEPLPAEDLESRGARSGYRVNGLIRPEMPVGTFAATLSLQTTIDEGRVIQVPLSATRPGPFSILGKEFTGNNMKLTLGEFPATDGVSATVSLFSSDRRDEPLQFVSTTSDPEYLKVECRPDEDFKAPSRERYILTFTVPPGTPPVRRMDDRLASVHIVTNRPEYSEMRFNVAFWAK